MQTNKLHNIKETGFKVPKDYFDTLEDTVLDNIKLKEQSSEPGFKTPDNYFETLEDTILSKVSEKESPKVISIFSRRNLIYASSIAAAVLLLLNLSIFENESGWEDIEAETVENYIINENMGSYEIASLLIDEELNEDNLTDIEFSDDALENYFLDHTTVEDLIIN
tara:strand:- start:8909 stop:9406 length:498 start_codon:yes stop_codon:yes gene_type:complete